MWLEVGIDCLHLPASYLPPNQTKKFLKTRTAMALLWISRSLEHMEPSSSPPSSLKAHFLRHDTCAKVRKFSANARIISSSRGPSSKFNLKFLTRVLFKNLPQRSTWGCAECRHWSKRWTLSLFGQRKKATVFGVLPIPTTPTKLPVTHLPAKKR